MSDTGQIAADAVGSAAPIGAATAAAAPRRSRFGWKLLVVLALLAAAGGAAAYVFLVQRPASHGGPIAVAEPPLPFYLEVKPIVVSMRGSDGAAHFVQLGVNLTLSGTAAGNLVDAMLPEVEDAMRMSALSFKVEDIETPAGIDHMRAKMTADINRMLQQRLGADRIARANGGSSSAGDGGSTGGGGGGRSRSGGDNKDAVQNIYFSTLVIE